MWLSSLVLTLAAASPAPSVLVLPLKPEVGVQQGVANVLSDAFMTEMRGAGVFQRVVGLREVEMLAQVEQQKQLLDCETDNCLAELGGALGVDLLVMGGVARLGDTFVLNLRMVESRRATVLSSVSYRVCGKTEATVLGAVKPATHQLLREASLRAPEATTAPHVTGCEDASTPVTSTERPLAILRVLGATGVLLGVPAGFAALALGMATVVAIAVPRIVYVPLHQAGLDVTARQQFWNIAPLLTAAPAGLAILAGIVLVTAGGIALAAGTMQEGT